MSLKPKATNSSLRPIKRANREKHKKEFICRNKPYTYKLSLISTSACDIEATGFHCYSADFGTSTDKYKRYHLTDNNILHGMTKLPVSKLMTQYRKDLWVVASLFLVLSKYLGKKKKKSELHIKTCSVNVALVFWSKNKSQLKDTECYHNFCSLVSKILLNHFSKSLLR